VFVSQSQVTTISSVECSSSKLITEHDYTMWLNVCGRTHERFPTMEFAICAN